jgi:hypothetical protein
LVIIFYHPEVTLEKTKKQEDRDSFVAVGVGMLLRRVGQLFLSLFLQPIASAPTII